jgi:hypothetical protein
LDEPLLSFSPSDTEQVDVHPLRGLVNFGPYSKGSFGRYTSQVRIATVGPESSFKRRGDLMVSLRGSYQPSDRSEYVPPYPGFEALFRVKLEAARSGAHIKWPDSLNQLPGDGDPQARLFQAMDAALRRLDMVRNEFDVVLVHFPDSWAPEGYRLMNRLYQALPVLTPDQMRVINDVLAMGISLASEPPRVRQRLARKRREATQM